jgi:hypothetical protein
MRQGGLDAGDFVGINSDTCVGTFVAAGASCQMNEAFTPTSTGTRTATVTVIDSAANSPQIVTMTGTGTSVNGPTPVSVDTTGLTCTSGVCQLGFVGDQLVKNFYYTSFGALGDTAPPFIWSLVGGVLPPRPDAVSERAALGDTDDDRALHVHRQGHRSGRQAASQAFSLTVAPQIGLIALSGRSGTMTPWTYQNSLRRQGLLIFSAPPTGSPTDPLVLSGGFV